ncbi:unnamed protein product [Rotaria magnacalcarata]|uniref:Uncharacterized protein n=1 Tax=Rotaria magnacalcarata TaxID=392030 RepID=A0A8S2P4Q4_9BILA|nr:unnamed protein product [Rotaria magnacalcarata]
MIFFINSYQIFLLLLFIDSSTEYNPYLKTSVLRSLIQKRQILDGTAKSGGVAPKPPGSDSGSSHTIVSSSSSTQQSPIHPRFSSTLTTTILMRNDLAQDRSVKDTISSNSNSKTGLIASILAPTGIVGVIGAVIGTLFYKKNQNNSLANEAQGFLSRIFNRNSNEIIKK